MSNQVKSDEVKTVKELRSVLKKVVHDEFQHLPETLKNMEPKDRLELVVKLLPYAMPKNEKASFTYGEPQDLSW
jgi:hypothetical protein